jgi:hypothetical protein
MHWVHVPGGDPVDKIAAMRKAIDSMPELTDISSWMSYLYLGNYEQLLNGDSPEDA